MVSVLVIDPRQRFRDELSRSFANWFTVHTAATVTEAANLWARKKPEAALASMVQHGDDHGLELLGRLRRTSRGRDVSFIAYGRPGGSIVSDSAIEEACRRYGVAAWIPDALEPIELQARLLGQLLKLRTFDTQGRLPPLQQLVTPAPLADTPVLSARTPRPSSSERIRSIAKQEIGLVDKTWQEEEPTWRELLRSRASAKNLRRMVKKAVTGQGADRPSGPHTLPLDDTGS